MKFVLKVGDNNLMNFARATELLASEKAADDAFRRALNHTGSKAHTQVRRALAKQTGLRQGDVDKHGGLKITRANYRSLAYTITATGRAIPLKVFGAHQFAFGVRARPWGWVQRFEHAFINRGFPRSGRPVAGGHVFVRTSGSSLPIRRMYGPAIGKELVQGASRQAFQDAAVGLSARIAHEVRVLTDGVVG